MLETVDSILGPKTRDKLLADAGWTEIEEGAWMPPDYIIETLKNGYFSSMEAISVHLDVMGADELAERLRTYD